MSILEVIQQRHVAGKKSIAVLIDPDKVDDASRLRHLIHLANENCIDFFFVGGSLITTTNLAEVIQTIKEDVGIPVILFPGSSCNSILQPMPSFSCRSSPAAIRICSLANMFRLRPF